MAKYRSLRRIRRGFKITAGLIMLMTKCITGIALILLAVTITLAAMLPCLPLAAYRMLKPLSTT